MHQIAVKYMKQKLTEWKGVTDKSTDIAGDFNISLPTPDRTTRKKVSKNLEKLNNNINQQDLTDVYRTPRPTVAESTFFQLPIRRIPI